MGLLRVRSESGQCLTWQQAAPSAVLFSGASSTAFLFATCLSYLLLRVYAFRKRRMPEPVRLIEWPVWAAFIAVHVGDVVPEALILSNAATNGLIDTSLAFMVFSINCAVSCSTALGLMWHRRIPTSAFSVLSLVFYTAVGSLVTQVATILDHFEIDDKGALQAVSLAGGIVIGALMYMVLLRIEHWVHHHARPPKRINNELLLSLQTSLNQLREQYYQAQMHGSEDEQQQRLQRVDSLANIVRSLENAKGLKGSLSSQFAHEAEEAVSDILDERIEQHLQQQQQEGQSLIGIDAINSESVNVRFLRLVGSFFVVTIAYIGISFAFTPLFALLCTNPFGGYLNGLVEGFSAGVFLAKISGSLLPRLQRFNNRSSGKLAFFNIMFFMLGVIITIFMSLVPHFETGNGGGHHA